MPDPLFHEVQRIRHWWLWLVVLLVATLAWWSFARQILRGEPFGSNPVPDWVIWLVAAICGVLVPLTFLVARLVVNVSPEGLRLHYVPFRNRWIDAASVASWEVVSYRPIGEWGGWGIRFGFGRGWAYTAYGDRGVQLTLADGRLLLVGSQRPEALAEALGRMRVTSAGADATAG